MDPYSPCRYWGGACLNFQRGQPLEMARHGSRKFGGPLAGSTTRWDEARDDRLREGNVDIRLGSQARCGSANRPRGLTTPSPNLLRSATVSLRPGIAYHVGGAPRESRELQGNPVFALKIASRCGGPVSTYPTSQANCRQGFRSAHLIYATQVRLPGKALCR